jgi:hypothetical protein
MQLLFLQHVQQSYLFFDKGRHFQYVMTKIYILIFVKPHGYFAPWRRNAAMHYIKGLKYRHDLQISGCDCSAMHPAVLELNTLQKA